MAKILITGGSGLVGRAISELLVKAGHQPVWLGREEKKVNGIQTFKWNPAKNHIDKKAFEDVGIIIQLAGAGIADKRWTKKYKKEIIDSRIKSSELLFNCIHRNNFPIKTLVGASAIGYYGASQSDEIFTETNGPGNDFLSECCELWENSYKSFTASGIRTSVLRTGIVLSKNGGAYKSLSPLFRSGLGAAIGSGRQYFPWIHIHDLARMYIMAALESHINGVYNAVAPQLVTNQQFSKQLAQSLHRPFFLPNIPAPLLKLVIGESVVTLTEGLKISDEKINAAGFNFELDTLNKALDDLAS